MGSATGGGGRNILVVPETLQQVSSALEQTASAFHDEIKQLSARGEDLLQGWKGRAGPTFVEPFTEWQDAANDVVERLKQAAVFIAEANAAFVEADQA